MSREHHGADETGFERAYDAWCPLNRTGKTYRSYQRYIKQNNPGNPASGVTSMTSSTHRKVSRKMHARGLHPAAPWPLTLVVTWFGLGLVPRAPGTFGSLGALPFAVLISWAGGPWALVGAAVVVFLIGWWASEVYVNHIRQKDPGHVVIDEVAGQWLTLAVAPLDPVAYALGFVFFRIFDIFKPWPVRWADRRMGGGLGIMIDDVLAAGYAALALWAVVTVVPIV